MVITVENFTKAYGEKELFTGIDFSLDEGDKVGIVGVNGTGKSTFLKAVAGLVPVDDGVLTAMKGLRVEYLAQDKELTAENTVLTEVFRGYTPLMEALRGYELALKEIEEQPENKEIQERLARCSAVIDAEDGWGLEGAAKTVLSQLGISDYTEKAGNLSGGQQKRLALASALIQPCDLLLLDEPTNHLDSETIAWLEEYLKARKGALLMVTHDRYFLDHTATKILELDWKVDMASARKIVPEDMVLMGNIRKSDRAMEKSINGLIKSNNLFSQNESDLQGRANNLETGTVPPMF